MEYLLIKDEYIKLGQALKLSGLVGSGIDAKILINKGEILVNKKIELRRGKKLYKGDNFCLKDDNDKVYEIDSNYL